MAWQYRSQPSFASFDSAASSKSFGPVSLGRIRPSHTSGDSVATMDGFDDHGNKDALKNFIQQFASLNAVADDNMEQEEATAASPQVMGTTGLDDPSQGSIEDAEKLRSFTQRFVREDPLDTAPDLETCWAVAQDAAPVDLVMSPAMTATAVQAAHWMVPAPMLYQPVIFPVWTAATAVASAQPVVYEIDPPAATQGVTAQQCEIDAPATTQGGSDSLPWQNPVKRRNRSRSPSKQNGRTSKKQDGRRTRPHNSNGNARATVASESSRPNQTKTTKAQPIPYADEETWEERIEKRKDGLHDLRTSEAYTMNQDITQYAFGAWAKRPVSPDPLDTTLSKRKWEKQISGGRKDWRRIHGVRQLVCWHGFPEDDAVAAWEQAKEDMDDPLREPLIILRVKPLLDMGFEEQAARAALQQASNDAGRAVQILLGQ